MCCDADPDQLSAIQPHYDVGVEQIEADGRDNEQVHGGNVRRVITQEGPPSLTGRSTPLDGVQKWDLGCTTAAQSGHSLNVGVFVEMDALGKEGRRILNAGLADGLESVTERPPAITAF
jgi:hypothetical protein